MMNEARVLLDRLPALERPCDLDLLVFFARHPRTLMRSEQLARLLGYELNEIARSLDTLLRAGLLTRAQNRTRPVRMYVFAAGGSYDEVPTLVELASAREGRLALRRALTGSTTGRADGLVGQAPDEASVQAGERPSRVRHKAADDA